MINRVKEAILGPVRLEVGAQTTIPVSSEEGPAASGEGTAGKTLNAKQATRCL